MFELLINESVYLQTFNLFKSFLCTFIDVTLVSSQQEQLVLLVLIELS